MESRRRLLNHPLLSDEESAELVRRWREDRDENALWKLVRDHARLARLMTRQLRSRAGLDEDDLLQEGLLVLVKAASSYEPGRGGPFRTWAATKLRLHLGKSARREAKHEGRETRSSDPLKHAPDGWGANDRREAYGLLEEAAEAAHQARPDLVDRLAVEVFCMRAQGATNEQISEVLGIHRNTAAKRMRAINQAFAELGLKIGDLHAD